MKGRENYMPLIIVVLILLFLSAAHAQSLPGGVITNSVGSASSVSQSTGGAGGAGGMGGLGGAGGLGGLGGAGGLGGLGGAGGIGHGGAGGTAYGGAAGDGGDANAAGGTAYGGAANNAGNAQSLHMEQARLSPSVFMSAPMPTAPCQQTLGGFLSFIGGIGLAGSRTLEECELRETARIAHGIGQPEMAKRLLCMGKYAARLEACQQ